jgi:hypothetical protein
MAAGWNNKDNLYRNCPKIIHGLASQMALSTSLPGLLKKRWMDQPKKESLNFGDRRN